MHMLQHAHTIQNVNNKQELTQYKYRISNKDKQGNT